MGIIPVVLRLLIIVIAVWVQFSWFGPLRPFDVVPSLMLIVVLVTALWSSATTALSTAVVGGLLLDISSGADFGLRTGFFTVVALAVIAARQFGLHAESVLTATGILTVATVVFNAAVLGSIGGAPVDWSVVWWRIAAEVMVNNVLLLLAFGMREVTRNRRARVAAELRRGSWL